MSAKAQHNPLVTIGLSHHPLVRGATNEVEQNSQVPQGLAVYTALSALAIACQGLIDVQVPITESVVPTSLMILIGALSGERKTTVQGILFEAIRAFQSNQRTTFEEAAKRWEKEQLIREAKARALLKKIERKTAKGQSTDEEEQALLSLGQEAPPYPIKFKLLYEDTTSAALFRGLHEAYPSAGLVSSEGASILNGSALNDLAKQNSIWSGDTITVDRSSVESFELSGARLTVLAMVQPSEIKAYLERRGERARASGLWARFLICSPGSTQGTRYLKGHIPSWESCKRFNQRIEQLLKMNLDQLGTENFKRKVVRFSPEAARVWETYFNDVESMINDGKRYESAGDHASKLGENVARVAALLHYFEGFEGDISPKTLNTAIYICDSASRDFATLFMPPPQEELDAVLLNAWLDERYRNIGHLRIFKNTIRQSGPNVLRDKARLNNALAALEKQGLVVVFREGKTHVVMLSPFLGIAAGQRMSPTNISQSGI